ncbi:MAG: hypothetical protein ACLQVN_04215 [Bryobacteraceae bacterium]
MPAVALARLRPRLGSAWWQRVEARFRALARHRTASVAAVGLVAVGLRLAILPVEPVPRPGITDEFSHLLLGDTLAHGRLANPTHPMWRHFETIHVLQHPTYSSMYFPGQGLFLGFGEVVAHCPWAGVLLSVALLCAAVCWALQGWLPPAWALAGGLLCVLRFGLFSYWIDSYWGGAVPALGGALVLGACPRIRRCPGFRGALPAAAGLAILGISRPFDAVMLSVPLVVALAIRPHRLKPTVGRTPWSARVPLDPPSGIECPPPGDKPARGTAADPGVRPTNSAVLRSAAALVLVCGASIAWLCLYQSRVTGHALRPAYAVNQQTYGWPLTLPWFPARAMALPNRQMSDYYSWEREERQTVIHPLRYAARNAMDAMHVWSFYFGPILSLPLLFVAWIVRDRRMRLPLAVTGWMLVVLAVEDSRYPHYLSAVLVALLLIALQGIRHMRAAGRSAPSWLALARLLPVLILLVIAARLFVPPLRAANFDNPFVSWCCSQKGNLDRAAVLARLNQLPGLHLVLVKYRPDHVFTYEWVYNEADIDHAKVVWARDLGPEANRQLIQYFSDRHVWTVDAEEHPAEAVRVR